DLFTLSTTDIGINSSFFTMSTGSSNDGLMLMYAGQSPAPEPTTAALFGLGGSVLLGRRRKAVGASDRAASLA
ncbi:MAG: hypothetical protein JWM57_306, partial [Phycisphaerales bacterium]|nr:hypothetical protein [Phycisphaerales bacterium]